MELFTTYRRIRIILTAYLNYPPIKREALLNRKSLAKWKLGFISDKIRDAYIDIFLNDLESVISLN